MKYEAQYNSVSKKGVYAHKIHHGEVVPNAKVVNDAPSAFTQNLAAKKGNSGAKKLLLGRYTKA